MPKHYIYLFLGVFLCSGWVFSAPAALAQNDRNLYVKPETKAVAPQQRAPSKRAAPAPRTSPPEQQEPAAQQCSDRELKAFLRAREALDAPIRYIEETSSRGLSESEAEEFAVEAEKVLAKRKAMMDQPGFRKTYSALSIRCYERANPAKK